MPSDRYVTTRISREYLLKLQRLRGKHRVKSNTKMLHKLIDDALGPPKVKAEPAGPAAPVEIKPVGLPPPE